MPDIEKLFSVSLDMLCIATTDGYFKLVNPAFERVLGWPEKELLSRPFADFIHPDDVDATQLEVEKLSTGIPTVSFENRYRCVDGTYKHLVWNCHPDPATGFLYAVGRDITEFRKSQDTLRLAIEASPNGMLMVDTQGTIVMVNHAAEKLFGYPRGAMLGNPVDVLVPEKVREGHPNFRRDFLREPTARPMGKGRELTACRRDGTEIHVEVGLNPIYTDDGTFVLSAIIDLTARKAAESKIMALALDLEEANTKLTTLASTDGLTGLKNRRSFIEEFEINVRLGRRTYRPISLVLADLDNFKEYNDTFGHPEGDKALIETGNALLDAARRSDFVARYGGEEFAIGMPVTDREGSIVIVERLRQAIESISNVKRKLTVSFGISTKIFGEKDTTDESLVFARLMDEADAALYRSKKDGRNRLTHAEQL